MKYAAIFSVGLIMAVIGLSGCASYDEAANRAYIKDKLGGIVLSYKQKHGQLPQTFEQAHDDSKITLLNRGDLYGGAIVYEKVNDNSFYFLSFGANGRDDNGQGDDLKVEYNNGWRE
jgi:hypothetical protein